MPAGGSDGTAATLDKAKAKFREAWEKAKSNRLSPDGLSTLPLPIDTRSAFRIFAAALAIIEGPAPLVIGQLVVQPAATGEHQGRHDSRHAGNLRRHLDRFHGWLARKGVSRSVPMGRVSGPPSLRADRLNKVLTAVRYRPYVDLRIRQRSPKWEALAKHHPPGLLSSHRRDSHPCPPCPAPISAPSPCARQC